jgi:hypothetical protein
MNHYNLDCFAFKHTETSILLLQRKNLHFLIETLTNKTITNLQLKKGQSKYFYVV